MEGVGFDLRLDGCHLSVGDFDPAWVVVGVGFGVHGEPSSGRGGADDEFDDDVVAGQRPASPVHRDMRKQPVLDPVPFAGSWWEVADRDGQAGLVGKPGELELPQP